MFGFIYAGLVWITPQFQSSDGQFPFYYYLMVVIIYAIHQVLSTVKWMPPLQFRLECIFNIDLRSQCTACLLP